MQKIFGVITALAVLLLEPVSAVSAGKYVRLHGDEMHQKIEADQLQAASISPDGKVSVVQQQYQAANMHCANMAVLEGCKCDNRDIGPGITGNFVNDSLSFASFPSSETMFNSFWDYTAFLEGAKIPLKKFKNGKLTLIANIASA